MTRYFFPALFGFVLATTTIVMAILRFSPSQVVQSTATAGLMTAAAFALVTAYNSKSGEIQQKHNLLQSFGMFGHGFIILFTGSSFNQFIMINLAFLVYFAVTEILFAFELSSNQTAALLVTSGITLLRGIGFVLQARHVRGVPARLSIDPATSTDRIFTNTIY